MALNENDRKELCHRVKRGVALLDEKEPGWRDRLLAAQDRFDIRSGFHCVLGEVYGDYSNGCEVLGLYDSPLAVDIDLPAAEHGFTVEGSPMDYNGAQSDEWHSRWNELQYLWEVELYGGI